jgi:hypothetical protein
MQRGCDIPSLLPSHHADATNSLQGKEKQQRRKKRRRKIIQRNTTHAMDVRESGEKEREWREREKAERNAMKWCEREREER